MILNPLGQRYSWNVSISSNPHKPSETHASLCSFLASFNCWVLFPRSCRIFSNVLGSPAWRLAHSLMTTIARAQQRESLFLISHTHLDSFAIFSHIFWPGPAPALFPPFRSGRLNNTEAEKPTSLVINSPLFKTCESFCNTPCVIAARFVKSPTSTFHVSPVKPSLRCSLLPICKVIQ